jgi:hypothetical protein
MHIDDIVVSWPQNDDNITAEAQYFTPYGPETTGLGSVTLTGSGDNEIPLISSTDVAGSWSAWFDPLSPDTYTLVVTDAAGTITRTVTGLTVNG